MIAVLHLGSLIFSPQLKGLSRQRWRCRLGVFRVLWPGRLSRLGDWLLKKVIACTDKQGTDS